MCDRKSSTKGNRNPLKGRDSVRFPGVADSCSCFSEGLSQISGVDGSSGMVVDFVASGSEGPRDPECDCRELKRRSKDDCKGRHFEASLILQAVSWYLRYPLSYRDIEELFVERGLAVDHATLNRWVLAYAPLIERRLRSFRKPHCGSICIDKTYIRVRGCL